MFADVPEEIHLLYCCQRFNTTIIPCLGRVIIHVVMSIIIINHQVMDLRRQNMSKSKIYEDTIIIV